MAIVYIFNRRVMNEQMLKDVLEDVLEELKEANRSLKDLRTRLSGLEGKVDTFEQKLNDQQVIVQPPDLAPVLGAISEQGKSQQAQSEAEVSALRAVTAEGIGRLSLAVEAQHKPIVRQWRLCFYPESDYSGNYKHFVNWLFVGCLLVLLIGVLYALGSQYLERRPPPPPQESCSTITAVF